MRYFVREDYETILGKEVSTWVTGNAIFRRFALGKYLCEVEESFNGRTVTSVVWYQGEALIRFEQLGNPRGLTTLTTEQAMDHLSPEDRDIVCLI